jgi:hypothetical protein
MGVFLFLHFFAVIPLEEKGNLAAGALRTGEALECLTEKTWKRRCLLITLSIFASSAARRRRWGAIAAGQVNLGIRQPTFPQTSPESARYN